MTSSHSMTLTSLLPSQLYHYRVKSADTAGNAAYSSQYTFTTPSRTVIISKSLGAGWNLMSVPLMPVNPAPTSAFNGISLDGNLHRYDPCCCYLAYSIADLGAFGNVELGSGYWLHLNSPATVEYEGYRSLGAVAIPLPSACWHLIGMPQDADQPLSNCEVRDTLTSATKTLPAAAAAGWISVPLYYYDRARGGYLTCGLDPWDDDSSLRAWTGYWLNSLRANLELMVPKP